MPGKPMTHIAGPHLEMFFNEVMAAAQKYKLQDRELAAVLALMVGKMAGISKLTGTQEDYDTIVDTAIYNMKFGREGAAKELEALKALGKGH